MLFDRKGKIKLGCGIGHIVKNRGEVNSTLNQSSHTTLAQFLCDQLDISKNKANYIKEKFQQPGSSLSSDIELRKLDLFDLGVLLAVIATGGADVLSDEILSKLKNLNKHCCLFHAVTQSKDSQEKKAGISIKRILNRLS